MLTLNERNLKMLKTIIIVLITMFVYDMVIRKYVRRHLVNPIRVKLGMTEISEWK